MANKQQAELVIEALEEAFKDEPRVKAIELVEVDDGYAVRVIVDSTADMEATEYLINGVEVVFEECGCACEPE